jgi:hypothetical protein
MMAHHSRSFAKNAQDFGRRPPARKERALTPSKRLKLSPAGPMVLHAPSVWERRSLPALIKASLRNQIGLFLSRYRCGFRVRREQERVTHPRNDEDAIDSHEGLLVSLSL